MRQLMPSTIELALDKFYDVVLTRRYLKCSARVKVYTLSVLSPQLIIVDGRVSTFTGLQISQVCTGTPFLALLIRPVTGVYLTGISAAGSEPLEECRGLPDVLACAEPPA